MKTPLSSLILFVLTALAAITATPCQAQEIYTCPRTGKEYLSLGSISLEGKEKFLENGEICWEERDSLKQSGFLNTVEFLDTIFSQNLQITMEGYEPFWKARLTKDSLFFCCYDEPTTYPVRIIPSRTLSSHIYIMFESQQGRVFGSIDYTGQWNRSDNKECWQCCEFNIEENRQLYSVFITVGDIALEGCVNIQAPPPLE